MSAFGIFGTSSESLSSMLRDLYFDEKARQNVLLKTMNDVVTTVLQKKQKFDQPSFV